MQTGQTFFVQIVLRNIVTILEFRMKIKLRKITKPAKNLNYSLDSLVVFSIFYQIELNHVYLVQGPLKLFFTCWIKFLFINKVFQIISFSGEFYT